jgi:hypothetical protein
MCAAMARDMRAELAPLRAEVAALRAKVAANRAGLDEYDTALEFLAGALQLVGEPSGRDRHGRRLVRTVAPISPVSRIDGRWQSARQYHELRERGWPAAPATWRADIEQDLALLRGQIAADERLAVNLARNARTSSGIC